MADYLVTYSINVVDAIDPLDAAQQVALNLTNRWALRAVYKVKDLATGETVSVELGEDFDLGEE